MIIYIYTYTTYTYTYTIHIHVTFLSSVCVYVCTPCIAMQSSSPGVATHHFEAPASKPGCAPVAAAARTPARPPTSQVAPQWL